MSKLHIKFEPSSLNNEDFQILDKKGVFPPLKLKKLENFDGNEISTI